jgi:hypothetical protein
MPRIIARVLGKQNKGTRDANSQKQWHWKNFPSARGSAAKNAKGHTNTNVRISGRGDLERRQQKAPPPAGSTHWGLPACLPAK